jgi:hypothetical protein
MAQRHSRRYFLVSQALYYEPQEGAAASSSVIGRREDVASVLAICKTGHFTREPSPFAARS